jgi:zinc protease
MRRLSTALILIPLTVLVRGNDLPFEIRREKLDNGLLVVAAQKEGLPVFEARVGFRSGSLYDASGKEGTANLTFRLLDKGTKHRDQYELQEAVDFLGGGMTARVDLYAGELAISVLSIHAEVAMELLSDAVRFPLFDEQEVEDEKERISSEISNDRSNPSRVLRKTFFRAAYGDHALGNPVMGYENSVQALTRADVRGFYDRFFRPERAVLVMVSDLPIDRMIELGRSMFEDWDTGTFEPDNPAEPEQLRGKHLRLVHMDVNQAYASFGHLGVERSDPDFNAMEVVDFALGGSGFSSRFMKQVRREMGYAYDVWSHFYTGFGLPGLFRTGIETKLETAHDAIRLMLDITRDIHESGVTREELDVAKSYYEGAVPRRTETYGQIAARLMAATLFDLPEDYWIRDMEEIQTLTLDRVNRAASLHLRPDDFVLVIVGDTSKLDIEKLGITFDSKEILEIE